VDVRRARRAGRPARRWAWRRPLSPGRTRLRIGFVARSRAGAIYWANSIANTIRAADAAAIDAALGEALCVVALGNRDLSGPMQPLAPYDQLGTRVMEDGLRCLGAWCKSQPAGVGLRVRLKLAPDPALDDAVKRPFDELGPAIVRRTIA